MSSLKELLEHGQSYWLDNLTRSMIRNGELKRRVERQGLRGVTSNPAIFNKAISQSSDYDAQVQELVFQELSVSRIYESLVVDDVRDACDVLRPVYRKSDGRDGFVSLEVSPYLAHDTEQAMREARRLFKAVNRPNVMIKIPGTSAGVPAIEQMLYEGIPINITLLFSLSSYQAVAEAYLRALEKRAKEGLSLENVASVASFFLSRIDVLVDLLLSHRMRPENSKVKKGVRPEDLLGTVAVANARLAYQKYLQIFDAKDKRWKALSKKGARVQRLLWASTSTKDPLYRDVRYVEPLIGPDTVNTMPDETIEAFRDHGRAEAGTLLQEIRESKKVLSSLPRVGVRLATVTEQLEHEGVQKFITPFDSLMGALADKRMKILGRKAAPQQVTSGELEKDLKAVFAALDQRQFSRRLFAGDGSLWKQDSRSVKAIENRLGWIRSPRLFQERLEEIRSFADRIRKERFRHVVLLGMGGSSLCPEMAARTFGPAAGRPELLVLDNTSPEAVRGIESSIDPKRTLFLVASKSGETLETECFFRHFYRFLEDEGIDAAKAFVAITDPASPLAAEAGKLEFRHVFENPADIGGRYAALSYFGLVPMALLGIRIDAVLKSGVRMLNSCGPWIPSALNPALKLGALLGVAQKTGRDKLTLVFSRTVESLSDWVEQLVAESTGKEGRGIVPITYEQIRPAGDYRDDRVFVQVVLRGDPTPLSATREAALKKAGHPVVRIDLASKEDLGGEFVRWEIASATAGRILGCNPFDEPDVSQSKKNTERLLASRAASGKLSEDRPAAREGNLSLFWDQALPGLKKRARPDEALRSFLNLAQPGDYAVILPYFGDTTQRQEELQRLRRLIGERTGVATSLGFGPRYLHSTGQLHKGGPAHGLHLILTSDSDDTGSIPGKKFGFATLQKAQALGDLRALQEKGRRVVRIHVAGDVETGLHQLRNLLDGA